MWFRSWEIALWKAGHGYSKYYMISHGYVHRWSSGTTPLKWRHISSWIQIVTPFGIPLVRQIWQQRSFQGWHLCPIELWSVSVRVAGHQMSWEYIKKKWWGLMPIAFSMTGSCCLSLTYISSILILVTYYWFFHVLIYFQHKKSETRQWGSIFNTRCILTHSVLHEILEP